MEPVACNALAAAVAGVGRILKAGGCHAAAVDSLHQAEASPKQRQLGGATMQKT